MSEPLRFYLAHYPVMVFWNWLGLVGIVWLVFNVSFWLWQRARPERKNPLVRKVSNLIGILLLFIAGARAYQTLRDTTRQAALSVKREHDEVVEGLRNQITELKKTTNIAIQLRPSDDARRQEQERLAREAKRRRIRDRLGELRQQFIFSRDFALVILSDGTGADIEKLWAGYTSTWKAALDFASQEKDDLGPAYRTLMESPPDRYFVRIPYKTATSEHARLWRQAHARVQLLEDVIKRFE